MPTDVRSNIAVTSPGVGAAMGPRSSTWLRCFEFMLPRSMAAILRKVSLHSAPVVYMRQKGGMESRSERGRELAATQEKHGKAIET